jgi:hypothetical protein
MAAIDLKNFVPGPSQAQANSTIGGGHPATPQVLPGNIAGNRPTPATASVTGDTPVFQAYSNPITITKGN